MTIKEKVSLIDLIESYKPDGNYYDGYHNTKRKCDEAICEVLNELISEILRYPTTDNTAIITMTKQPTDGEILQLNNLLNNNLLKIEGEE